MCVVFFISILDYFIGVGRGGPGGGGGNNLRGRANIPFAPQ